MLKFTDEQKQSLIESGTFTAEQLEKLGHKRTTERIISELCITGRITLLTKDVLTIKHTSGVISDTITVNLKNDEYEEDVTFSLPNCIECWTYLKNVMEFTKVMYQIDDSRPIPFEESLPYKARF